MAKLALTLLAAAAMLAVVCADASLERTHRRLSNCHARGAACEAHDHRCHHDASVCYMSVGEALEETNRVHQQYAAVHAMGCRMGHWIAAGKPAKKPAGMSTCMLPDPRLLVQLDAESGRRLAQIAASAVVGDCDNFDADDAFDFLGSGLDDFRPTQSDAAHRGFTASSPIDQLDDDSFSLHVTDEDIVRFQGSDMYSVYDGEGDNALFAVILSTPSDDYICMLDFGDPNGKYGITMRVTGTLEDAATDDDGNFVAVYVINYETGEYHRVYVTGDDDTAELDAHIYAHPGEFIRWISYADDDGQLNAALHFSFGTEEVNNEECDVLNTLSTVKYLPNLDKFVTTEEQDRPADYRMQGDNYWILRDPVRREFAICSSSE